jgi:hypothetical protein
VPTAVETLKAIPMAHGTVSEIIPATSAEVFALVHDYDRRLEWDTLLSAAYLTDGHTVAQQGAVSTCVGRAAVGSMALTTEYVAFAAPRLAAVKMIRGPWLFERWAASLKHEDLADGTSRITYAWQFSARPWGLRWLFEPLLNFVFYWETRKRLRALREFLGKK